MKKQISISISGKVLTEAKAEAAKENRSLSNYIEDVLRRHHKRKQK